MENWRSHLKQDKAKSTASKYAYVLAQFFDKHPIRKDYVKITRNYQAAHDFFAAKVAEDNIGYAYQKVIKAALGWLSEKYDLEWKMKKFKLQRKVELDNQNPHNSIAKDDIKRVANDVNLKKENPKMHIAFKIQYAICGRVQDLAMLKFQQFS